MNGQLMKHFQSAPPPFCRAILVCTFAFGSLLSTAFFVKCDHVLQRSMPEDIDVGEMGVNVEGKGTQEKSGRR
jgi:hypothetical protein